MRAGKLDRAISIERRTDVVAPSGSVSSVWTAIAKPRAEILQQSSNESLTGFGEAEAGTIIFRVRYLPGITTKDRVTYNGTAYDLEGIKEIGRRRGLELQVVATA